MPSDPTFEKDPLDRADPKPDWDAEIPFDGEPAPTLPKLVKLSWPQWYFAAQVGLMRYTSSRQANLGHKYGYGGEDGVTGDIAAAAAELAAAIAIDETWNMGVNTFKDADVGTHTQVRYTPLKHGNCLIRDGDPSDHKYVLVRATDDERTFNVIGWIWGSDAKQEQWKKAPNERPPAFFVPQEELNRW